MEIKTSQKIRKSYFCSSIFFDKYLAEVVCPCSPLSKHNTLDSNNTPPSPPHHHQILPPYPQIFSRRTQIRSLPYPTIKGKVLLLLFVNSLKFTSNSTWLNSKYLFAGSHLFLHWSKVESSRAGVSNFFNLFSHLLCSEPRSLIDMSQAR